MKNLPMTYPSLAMVLALPDVLDGSRFLVSLDGEMQITCHKYDLKAGADGVGTSLVLDFYENAGLPRYKLLSRLLTAGKPVTVMLSFFDTSGNHVGGLVTDSAKLLALAHVADGAASSAFSWSATFAVPAQLATTDQLPVAPARNGVEALREVGDVLRVN